MTTYTIDLGEWHVFAPSHQQADKWQALKVLEEAAEVVDAAKHAIECNALQTSQVAQARQKLTNEIADLLQTTANLCDAYGITETDLIVAQVNCNRKNLERGMFEPGERTRMHR